MHTQQEIDAMADALRAQGLTWNQTNFAVSLVRNESTRLQAQVAELQATAVRAYAEGRVDEASSASGLQAQVDAEKADASLMRSIHAQAMESNGRTIASHLGTIQDLRAQVEALAVALEPAYALLARVQHNWPGRESLQGQQMLCAMRDAIALATGRDAEEVQNSVGR